MTPDRQTLLKDEFAVSQREANLQLALGRSLCFQGLAPFFAMSACSHVPEKG